MFVIIPNSVPDFLFLFLFFLFFFYEYQILFCHFYFSGVQEINMDNLDKDSFNVFNNLDFMYVNSYHCERNFISSFCFYPSFFFFLLVLAFYRYFSKFHYCMTFASKVQGCSPASDGKLLFATTKGRKKKILTSYLHLFEFWKKVFRPCRTC